MRAILIFLIMAMFITSPSSIYAQMQPVPGHTHRINQGLIRDLDLITGMMTDIDLLIRNGNITVQQRQQLMEVMGQLGGVMQQMGSAKEIEGWRLVQQRNKLNVLRKRLNVLKFELEGKHK